MLTDNSQFHIRATALITFVASLLCHLPAAAQTTGGVVPAPWASVDVGAPALAGDATEDAGTFTVKAAGRDIWGTADQFHFVHQLLTGDAVIVARVDSLANTNAWAKAGIMMRESLAAGSPHVSALVTPAYGIALQSRASAGATSAHTYGGGGAAPYWVGLQRQGDAFHAFASADGRTWRYIGSRTIPMMATIYVGLAVTSHNTGTRTTALFSNVGTLGTASNNQSPTVQITAPAGGATYTAPATISISAAASDPDGSVTKVDFYQGSTLIGSDATAPYSMSWTGVGAGTYTLSAAATDNDGASSRSASVSVTVRAASGGSTPYGGTAAAVPGTIQAENFDEGGEGVAYHDATAGNSGGRYRSTDVDIEATSDSGGGYNVGWAGAGEWLQYTVNVARAGTYTLEARVANTGSGGAFHVKVNGVNVSGTVTVPSTGGWQRWQTVSRTVTLGAGVQQLRLVLDTNGTSGAVGNFNYLRLVEASATSPTRAAFEPSADHATLVVSYRLEIFHAGSDPATAEPAATRDLGKPSPVNGVIDVDISADVQKLAAGTYFATVSAVGQNGTSRSAPSGTFSR